MMTNIKKYVIMDRGQKWITGVLFMAYFIIILALDIIAGLVYAKKGYPKIDMTAFWLKMLASGIFVFNGFYLYFNSAKDEYAKLIVAGLVLGMAGDALLSFEPFIKKNQYEQRNMVISTVIGAIFFLGGHVMYIIAFLKAMIKKDAFNIVIYLVSICVMFALAIGAKTAKKVKLGKLLVPFFIYAFVLASMGSFGICLALEGYSGHFLKQATLIVGPVFFVLSDTLMGAKFADRKRFGTLSIRYVTLFTYYVAQTLIGFTIYYV